MKVFLSYCRAKNSSRRAEHRAWPVSAAYFSNAGTGPRATASSSLGECTAAVADQQDDGVALADEIPNSLQQRGRPLAEMLLIADEQPLAAQHPRDLPAAGAEFAGDGGDEDAESRVAHVR